jgi:hypothetical protein
MLLPQTLDYALTHDIRAPAHFLSGLSPGMVGCPTFTCLRVAFAVLRKAFRALRQALDRCTCWDGRDAQLAETQEITPYRQVLPRQDR